jgi:hypothetical protein
MHCFGIRNEAPKQELYEEPRTPHQSDVARAERVANLECVDRPPSHSSTRSSLLSLTADQTLAHRCVRVCSLRCKIGEQGRWIVFAAHGARACAWNESPAPGLNYRTLGTRVAAAAAAEPNCAVALFAGITLKTLGQSGLRFIVSLRMQQHQAYSGMNERL